MVNLTISNDINNQVKSDVLAKKNLYREKKK